MQKEENSAICIQKGGGLSNFMQLYAKLQDSVFARQIF